MCVDESAVAGHLAHGDNLGSCSNSCSTPSISSAKVASDSNTSRENKSSTKENKNAPQDKDIEAEAYPNPFKSTIYVQVSNPDEKEISMNMFDLMGKNVPIKPLNNTPEGVHVLDTERLSAGLYLLQVKVGDYSKTVKLIKE
jgi:hypothetical protein